MKEVNEALQEGYKISHGRPSDTSSKKLKCKEF
jgi:hypothetical protein